ncbi:MAG: hypothetical protein KA163_06560 [Bacteroidia bacterium]|nr:hypothetical protein [Bacteroidia bacterium]
MKNLIFFFLLTSIWACNTPKKENRDFQWAQIVGNTYLDTGGDTVNRFDTKNRKQGKWMVWREGANENSSTNINSLESEGFYKNDKKEGYWKNYTLYGEITDSILYVNGIQQITNPKTYTVN